MASRPPTRTAPTPKRAVIAGTASCTATVAIRKTAVTTPAVLAAAPPVTA
jgi:hypothetical protein